MLRAHLRAFTSIKDGSYSNAPCVELALFLLDELYDIGSRSLCLQGYNGREPVVYLTKMAAKYPVPSSDKILALSCTNVGVGPGGTTAMLASVFSIILHLLIYNTHISDASLS
jgi:hypothetical protein